MINVKIINVSNNKIPEYKTIGSAGLDLQAYIKEPIIIQPLDRVLIPTGLFLEIPIGSEAQIRARSGLSINNGIAVVNGPGTIDSDYRGEVKVILINLGEEDWIINPGDRIAQMVFNKYEQAEFEEVEELSETERGTGGFGHTGI